MFPTFALALAATVFAAPAPDSTTLAFPWTGPGGARYWALRLKPGQDPRAELLRFARARGLRAGFVASAIGSVTRASLRLANQPGTSAREGHFEIVSLGGTLTRDGAHLHASFADSTGAVFGGHLVDGSAVYTTAEIVIGELSNAAFERETDPTYGYRELAPKKR